ncbi:hypothetical protein EON80_02560 [bacterium]|nr:MAG: hypothetical protein EON80_02560 [bacterium]
MNPSPHFIALESIQIATPCHADWNKMSGDDQSRFCQSCTKNVYNFSAMTRAEAERLILEKEGNLCVRLHRRADGTVITSDCPVGVSPVQRPMAAFGAMLAGILVSALAAVGVDASPQRKAPDKTIQISTGLTICLLPTPVPEPPIRVVRGSETSLDSSVRELPKMAPTGPPTGGPVVLKMGSSTGSDAKIPGKPAKLPSQQNKPYGNRAPRKSSNSHRPLGGSQ